MQKSTIWAVFTFLVMVLVTGAIYLYSSGLSLNLKKRELTKSGMIAVKSVPDSAQVYLNGTLTTATNGTITGLKPGTYNLMVIKNGFVQWQKDVEVFEQLATDITAVLVSKTPRLEPLTSEGARAPEISPTLTKIAYFTKNGKDPGVWLLPLAGNIDVNLFKSTTNVILKDTALISFSNGESIEWSPDEKEILVKLKENQYYLANLQDKTFEATTSAQPTKERWMSKVLEKRQIFLDRFSLPKNLNDIAIDSETVWSPDEKKFLYREIEDGVISYKVYDLEKPLPVGEKTNYITFTTKATDPQPKVYWYSDSFHLILVEGDIAGTSKGSIYLIRIDGTNKTEIYNNTLYSDKVFPTPSGDKIVVLTSFKSDAKTDLYATGIR